MCHHPAPLCRDGRGPLHSLRRSKGDKAGRRRRPRPSGGRIGRLKERLLVALFFYGLLTRSQERGSDGCIQLSPVQISLRATLGVRGTAKEREGILIALWHLPPLEAPALGVVPTHALQLYHSEDSTPRLNNSLALLYMDTYHGWALTTPLSSATTARSLFTQVPRRWILRTSALRSSKKFVRGLMHLVSLGLLLELPTSEALVNRKDVRGCKSGIWYAEPDKEGGGLSLSGSELNHHTLNGSPEPCAWALSAREH